VAFNRPTLVQIKDRVEADFKQGLGLSTILLRSFLKVMASALAGASHTIHGYIANALKQLFPGTADEAHLVRWANIFGINRLPAVAAEIVVTITGTDGVPIPGLDSTPTPAAIFQRSDGAEYQVKEEVTPSGGTVQATLVAVVAGVSSNVSNGSTLTLSSPISGINSAAVVASTTLEGEDQEEIEDLRTRLLERIQNPPAGGTVADYVAFAKTVTGVTRVWVLPGYLGQGTVGVTFVEDDQDPIIPTGPKVDAVQAAVDERKPVEADAIVFAPMASAINPTIRVKPNNSAVRAAITAELNDLIFREAQVRGAVDPARIAEGFTYDGKIALSKFNEAISISSGEDDHILVSPVDSPQPSEGGILTLGTITFQTLV